VLIVHRQAINAGVFCPNFLVTTLAKKTARVAPKNFLPNTVYLSLCLPVRRGKRRVTNR